MIDDTKPRPGRNMILAAVLRVERLEPLADQHVLVRPGAERPPDEAAVAGVERGDPAADAVFAAAVADHHFVLDDQGRHGDGLADVDVPELGAPELLAGSGIESDRLAVQRVEEHPAAGIGGAAVDGVAAGDALSGGERLRLVAPLERRTGFGQIKRIDDVRVGRDHEHGVLGHDRRRLLAAQHAQRERPGNCEPPDVPRVDLFEPAVAKAGQISAWHRPITILLCRARHHGDGHAASHRDRGENPRGGPQVHGHLPG
jgi:hypothetical protein